MRVLDLFCGMGGWSIGFHREGFECVGVDVVDVGYPYRLILQDVRELNGKDYRDFDVIVGSPPCRDFTILNDARWKEKKNPERGLELVKAFLRIVEESKPSFWLMENVVGLENYIEMKPRVHAAKLSPYMKRSFWGNFPNFLITCDGTKGKCRETTGWLPLASWFRAKIPIPMALGLARAIKERGRVHVHPTTETKP